MKVSLSGRQFAFPRQCACCGRYPTTSIPVSGTEANRRSRTKGWTWEIPSCTACKGHVTAYDQFLFAAFIFAAGLIGICLVSVAFDWSPPILAAAITTTVATAGGGLLKRRIEAACSPSCTGVGRPMTYSGSVGSVHTFEIKSRLYATAFIRENRHKVVNAKVAVAGILRSDEDGLSRAPRRSFRGRG